MLVWQQLPSKRPDFRRTAQVRSRLDPVNPPQHAKDIGVDDRQALPERKTANGRSRVQAKVRN